MCCCDCSPHVTCVRAMRVPVLPCFVWDDEILCYNSCVLAAVPAYGLPSSYCSVQAAPSEIPTVQFEPKFSPQFLNFFFRPCCCWSGLSLSLSRMPSRASRLLFPCPLWTTQSQQNHLRKWNHHAVLSLSASDGYWWFPLFASIKF
jgi:hypothetical protein